MYMYQRKDMLYIFMLCVHDLYTARPYESCTNIPGLAPPRCPFEAGTTGVKNISA